MNSITFKEWLINDPRFNCSDNLFYQNNFQTHNPFEENYLKLRKKEGRVYSDGVVRRLPDFHGPEPLQLEWRMRKRSADRLVNYLRDKQAKHILEIGCGNGWLVNYLHTKIASDYCGIDINESELKQAVRVSEKKSAPCFLYGDIMSESLNGLQADIIILASVVQYFSDLKQLIQKLFTHLHTGGEIHIIDTPFYNEIDRENARKRSLKYFSDLGIELTNNHYFHHHWKSIESFNHKVIYQPKGIFNRFKRHLVKDSPYPWVTIRQY